MRKASVFLMLYFVIGMSLKAQVVKISNGVILKGIGKNKSSLRIKVLSDKIIHVTDCFTGSFEADQELMDSESTRNPEFSLVVDNEKITLKTSSLHVLVDLKSRKVIFKDKDDHLILTEGNRACTAHKGSDGTLLKVKQGFYWSSDEILHFIGKNVDEGMMLKTGKLPLAYPSPETYPFVISSKGYGIVWKDKISGYSNDNELFSSFLFESKNQFDYYFLYGPSGEDVATNYCKLTGKAVEMPKLAQSEIKVENPTDVQKVIRK